MTGGTDGGAEKSPKNIVGRWCYCDPQATTDNSTDMPVQGIKAVTTARVGDGLDDMIRNRELTPAEWCRCLHPAVQAPRLSLLRLGRQLAGDGVCDSVWITLWTKTNDCVA